jgi:predicted RNA methylase
VIRNLTRATLTRLLAACGLARAAEVEHERRGATAIRAAERDRAGRAASAAAARLKDAEEKLRGTQERLAAEHEQREHIQGVLRHYLAKLRRTEADLAGRLSGERRIKLAQLAIGARAARRKRMSTAVSARVTRLAEASPQYASALAKWRAGDVPDNLQRVTLAGLHWSFPPPLNPAARPRVANPGWLPLQDLATIRRFVVGGIMLDVGAGVGMTSIPRVLLGDFAQAYAAEPDENAYLCLVGNVVDNHLEGRVLPDCATISNATGGVTLDDWIDRLHVPREDVRFVRIAMPECALASALEGATRLLSRRHIVWQIEVPESSLANAGGATLDTLSARLGTYFTHLKEIGGHSGPQWHRASEAGSVLGALAKERRAANLLFFNLRGGSVRARRTPAASAAANDAAERDGRSAMISLLHCTARLPDGWRPAMEAFLQHATYPERVEYILAVDEDQQFSLPEDVGARWGAATVVKQGVNSPVSGYNAAARIARGEILMQIADDYFPRPGWDVAIRRAIPDVGGEVVLDVDNSDGSTWLLPFSILTRRYYERYGYVFYPGYQGLLGDNEFTEQARRDRVVRDARHIVFEHRHPDRGMSENDQVYVRQKNRYSEGEQLFRERQAKGFPKWPD